MKDCNNFKKDPLIFLHSHDLDDNISEFDSESSTFDSESNHSEFDNVDEIEDVDVSDLDNTDRELFCSDEDTSSQSSEINTDRKLFCSDDTSRESSEINIDRELFCSDEDTSSQSSEISNDNLTKSFKVDKSEMSESLNLLITFIQLILNLREQRLSDANQMNMLKDLLQKVIEKYKNNSQIWIQFALLSFPDSTNPNFKEMVESLIDMEGTAVFKTHKSEVKENLNLLTTFIRFVLSLREQNLPDINQINALKDLLKKVIDNYCNNPQIWINIAFLAFPNSMSANFKEMVKNLTVMDGLEKHVSE